MDEDALSFSLAADLRRIGRGAPQKVHVVADVVAKVEGVEPERSRLSTIFVLDVSGSMSGPPLEHVVRSVEKLANLFDATDRVGVVAFGDYATEVAPRLLATPDHKQRLCSCVRRLAATGSTNLEGGLRLAARMFPPRALEERQILLVLSDGQPNVGLSTADGLVPVVAAMRPHVSVSTLGYGLRHNESVLHAIASAGAGRYHFVPDPQTCQQQFALALGAQGDVVAEALSLTLVPAAGVEIVGLMGGLTGGVTPRSGLVPPGRSATGSAALGALVVPLTDMLCGERRIAVVETLVRVDEQRPAADVLRGRLTYHRARRKAPSVLEETASVEVGAAPGDIAADVHAKVLLARSDDVRRQARALADRSQWDGASRLLRAFLAEIAAAPGFAAGTGTALAEAYELLVDEAMAMERHPNAEAYRAFRMSTLGVSAICLAAPAKAPPGARSLSITMASAGEFPRACLRVLNGPEAGNRFPLGARNSIGRTPASNVVIADPKVSRTHAEVFAQDGRFSVADLGSTNSTWLNGAEVHLERRPLSHGDVLGVGGVDLRYEEERK